MDTEKVKIGLLGLIAVTLIINTYYIAVGDKSLPAAVSADSGDTSFSSLPQGDNSFNGNNVNTPAINNALGNPQTNVKNPTLNSLPNPNSNIPSGPVTNIKFANDVKDFGEVKAQSENTYAFEFVNTGNEPLLIENAKGSCGCTVPDWPRDPIAPGAKGVIDVVFKPKNRDTKGEDKKTVTVTANTNPKTTVLTVRALVQP